MHENIGADFKGNPIIVVYDSNSPHECKWIDNNYKPAKSIFDLVADILEKNTDDLIDICAKELLRNKKITSILRPAYKQYEKEGRLHFQVGEKINTIDLGNSDGFEYNKSKLANSVSKLPLKRNVIQEIRKHLAKIKTEKKLDKSIYTIRSFQRTIKELKDELELSEEQPILKLKQVRSIIKNMEESCDQSMINTGLFSIMLEKKV